MKPQSPPRFNVIDQGRGLAVLLMIFVHTLWMYANEAVQADSLLGDVIHFIGKGTAAFLFLMGVSMVLSKNQSLKSDCLRGLLILFFGYLMNTLKFIVPIELFGTMPAEFVAAYGWESPLSLPQWLYLIGTGDILQMVGISLFLIGIVRPLTQNPWLIAALGLGVAAISGELRGIANSHETFGYIARLLFSDHYQVYFPVFPWMSFILFGLAFGLVLKRKNFEHTILFNQSLWLALSCLAVGGLLCWYNFEYHFHNFFHTGLGGVLYLFGINMLLFFVMHKLAERGTDNPFTRFLTYLSKRVTSIYVIQWVLICWGMGLVGFQTLSATETLMMMPVTLVCTLVVQWLKDKLLSKKKIKPVEQISAA